MLQKVKDELKHNLVTFRETRAFRGGGNFRGSRSVRVHDAGSTIRGTWKSPMHNIKVSTPEIYMGKFKV